MFLGGGGTHYTSRGILLRYGELRFAVGAAFVAVLPGAKMWVA